MFTNYIKTALRNLKKNKLYSAINIIGLAVGITACLLIGVYIRHELSYDRFHVNGDRIVRVTMQYRSGDADNTTATTGTKDGPQLKRVLPGVEEYVRTSLATRVMRKDDRVFEEKGVLYADDPFFRMFTFPLIEGNPATALDGPGKIVLTESAAYKYFGTTHALNETIAMGSKDYTVSGVCKDVPQDSQLKFDFVTRFLNLGNVQEETWWTANWITFLLVNDKKSIPALQQQVNDYMSSAEVRKDAGLEGDGYLKLHLEPLTRVHLYSPLAGFEPNGSISYIYLFAIIALLILIIASANYTNLATAQSSGRSAEIGMRKVMGASRKQLFFQFIGESAVITGIATVLAFGLSLLVLPYFNEITGRQFTADAFAQPSIIIAGVLLAVVISFLAGAYPALVLSGTRIMGILKKGFTFTGGNNLLRKTLIVVQFGISVFLIIFTIVVLNQMHYMHNKNLGYDKEHLVILPIDGKIAANYESIHDAIAQVSGVQGVTAAYETPEFIEWGDGITVTDEKAKHEISVNAIPVDLGFIQTMKMQLLTGRDFQQGDFALMDTSHNYLNYHRSYIINETLAKKIGWSPQQAIGRTISKGATGEVVGVVKDFHFSSLHDPIGPLVIFLDRDMARTFIVRVDGNNLQSTIGKLGMMWKQRVPHRPFEYHFLDEDYDKLYLAEQRSSALFGVAALLAIVLAGLGLFGLAAFTTVQRTKEIGIRRVLGATLQSITLMVARSFLLLVGIAILIAIPLAWYAAHSWLEGFAFRVGIGAWVFLATAALTGLITLFTVGFHAVRASLLSPVKSLRSE